MSTYRPRYNAPPPPPNSFAPPLPLGPPPSYDPRKFSIPQTDFSFRSQDQAPQYPRGDSYRPADYHQSNQQAPNRSESNGNSKRGRRNPRRGGRAFRGRAPKVLPSDRPLLQQHDGENGDEQMLGVAVGTQKFIPVDEISDVDEEKDSESCLEQEQGLDGGVDESQEPSKKRRIMGSEGGMEGDSVPKWSNPDPYSVLPPVDDVNRKRKDPVAFIRKGFKPSEDKATEQSQVAANDDFISFGNDDDDVSSTPSEPRDIAEQTLLDLANGAHFEDLTNADDPFLGSRKRTNDDEIKYRLQHKSPSNPNGSLLPEWVPRTNREATPWLEAETASIARPGFRLHREICDWFEFVKPQPHEQLVRQELLSRLQHLIGTELQKCTVHCFGSFAAGLYLPNADMDIVINSDVFTSYGEPVICQAKSKIHRFGQFIRNSRMARDGSVEVVASAKVPIVKFVDDLTGIKVDVSFENGTGLAANKTFAMWKQQFPAASVIIAVVKQFLMMRGLNEVQYGGLGGFSVTCLVVSLLQNMPRVQNGSLIPEQNLGETLIEFLDFYGNRIDLSRTGIMMNPPGYFDKQAMDRSNSKGRVYKGDRAERLAIIDPNRQGNDISGGSKKVGLIFDRFARAHTELLIAMRERNRPSFLDWLLGGNYESFARHRAHLLNLYTTSTSAIPPPQEWPSFKYEALDEFQALSHPESQERSHPPVGRAYLEGPAYIKSLSGEPTEIEHALPDLKEMNIALRHQKNTTNSSLSQPTNKIIHHRDEQANELEAPSPERLEATGNRHRAIALKQLYPEAANLPDSRDKATFKALKAQLAKYATHHKENIQ